MDCYNMVSTSVSIGDDFRQILTNHDSHFLNYMWLTETGRQADRQTHTHTHTHTHRNTGRQTDRNTETDSEKGGRMGQRDREREGQIDRQIDSFCFAGCWKSQQHASVSQGWRETDRQTERQRQRVRERQGVGRGGRGKERANYQTKWTHLKKMTVVVRKMERVNKAYTTNVKTQGNTLHPFSMNINRKQTHTPPPPPPASAANNHLKPVRDYANVTQGMHCALCPEL